MLLSALAVRLAFGPYVREIVHGWIAMLVGGVLLSVYSARARAQAAKTGVIISSLGGSLFRLLLLVTTIVSYGRLDLGNLKAFGLCVATGYIVFTFREAYYLSRP